ncbi:MAG TPA: Calx-beta domain-containing protein, partial [Ilumatobacteraceae bacterium]|nr:Calx-beta domain-containing protein [Ilumatobacteraceae bacterium]
TLFVNLTDASNGGVITRSQGVGTILNDDVAPTAIAFEQRVLSSLDDVEQQASGSMYITSSDLELVDDVEIGGVGQTVGVRFSGVNIPHGVHITKAYIQFQAKEVWTGPTSVVIHGENSANAAAFANVTNNVSSRAQTAASVAWTPTPWTTIGEAGAAERTPDITSIVQSIVGLGGWSALNSMVFIITGSGTRTAVAYDLNPAAAPLLHIEYVPDAPPLLDLDGSLVGTGWSTTFTQKGTAAPIADLDAVIADSDDVRTASATITLINAKSGDQLQVNAAGLPAGITVDPRSTASNVILTGSATAADYQTALHQVGFNNTTNNHDTTARTINVVVNDGAADSNTAVATIAINLVPTAVDDQATTPLNTPVITGNVLANDDPGNAPIKIADFSAVSAHGGTVAYNGDSTFTYAPVGGFAGNDTFTYTIADIDGDRSTGTVTLQVGQNPVVGNISISDVSITEGDTGTKTASFTVSRTGTAAFTVGYATANGTATAGSDYLAASGTLSFAAGQASQTISVRINGDTVVEPDETLFVNLTDASNGGVITRSQGVGTILNDDVAPTAIAFEQRVLSSLDD